jgi:hypothetical protein
MIRPGAVEQANALHPHLILLGGDYVCADVESICELAPILGRLNAKYGVFAVPGNYDALLGLNLIRAQLVAQSIEVLVNRGLRVGPSAGQLFLAGLDSICTGVPDPIRAFCRLPGKRYWGGPGARAGLLPDDGQINAHAAAALWSQPWRPSPAPAARSAHPTALGRIYHTGLYELTGALSILGAASGWWDYRCGLIVPQSSRR